MSLNCLACTLIPRTDSYKEHNFHERVTKLRGLIVRNWSGAMVPPDDSHQQCQDEQKKMKGPLAKIRAKHRRIHSASDVDFPGGPEPRLVRSCGVRRNWSFEDLGSQDLDNSMEIH